MLGQNEQIGKEHPKESWGNEKQTADSLHTHKPKIGIKVNALVAWMSQSSETLNHSAFPQMNPYLLLLALRYLVSWHILQTTGFEIFCSVSPEIKVLPVQDNCKVWNRKHNHSSIPKTLLQPSFFSRVLPPTSFILSSFPFMKFLPLEPFSKLQKCHVCFPYILAFPSCSLPGKHVCFVFLNKKSGPHSLICLVGSPSNRSHYRRVTNTDSL